MIPWRWTCVTARQSRSPSKRCILYIDDRPYSRINSRVSSLFCFNPSRSFSASRIRNNEESPAKESPSVSQPSRMTTVRAQLGPPTVRHTWDGGVPRRPASQSSRPKEIAIIGGGITGLTTAYGLLMQHALGDDSETNSKKNLSAVPPKITIYEASSRLGGWMQSRRVTVPGDPDGGTVLLESGPRTLRPDKGPGVRRTVMAMIERLGLAGDLVSAHVRSPAATNRFMYYPDHLVRLPSPGNGIFDFLRFFLLEPLGKGILYGGLREVFGRPYTGPRRDMSIGEFITSRSGPSMADLASGGFHGIYAGDIDKLSVGAIMPKLQHWVWRFGSIFKGMTLSRQEARKMGITSWLEWPEVHPIFDPIESLQEHLSSPEEIEKLLAAETSSVYSFHNGLGQIPQALEGFVRKAGVTVKTNTSVSAIEVHSGANPGVSIRSSDGSSSNFTQAVATIPGSSLAPLIQAPQAHREDMEHIRDVLQYNPAVTVMVVNLYFKSANLVPPGFGYLLPRHIPIAQNPELALGVVFDSDAIQGQDTVRSPGTKLTVMLGGHWWDHLKANEYPSEEEGIQMARSVLERQMKITEAPLIAEARLQRNCIPQYHVGHRERMIDLHNILVGPGFEGQLMVGGSSYSGVSVNDCIKSGLRIGHMIRENVLDSGLLSPTSEWCAVPLRIMNVVEKSVSKS